MFVRYISHEIRTPLNTVLMGLNLLRDELVKKMDCEDFMDTIQDIHSSCDIAVHTLNDMLTYDKLENSILVLDKELVPAQSFINDVVRPFCIQVCVSVIHVLLLMYLTII